MIPKGRKILAVSAISVGLACFFWQTGLKAQNRAGNEQAEIGFEVAGSRYLNKLLIPVSRFVGECPGEAVGSIRAMFTSSTTPPGADRRVVVRNLTRGLSSDPFPYTDREYNKGRASEPTEVTFGTGHSGSHFVVLDGENDFEYEIKEGKTVLERGSFTADVKIREESIERNRQVVEQRYCSTNQPMSDCKKEDVRVRQVRACPSAEPRSRSNNFLRFLGL